jgi:hypothetical protein
MRNWTNASRPDRFRDYLHWRCYGARFRRPSVGSFLAVQLDSPAQ